MVDGAEARGQLHGGEVGQRQVLSFMENSQIEQIGIAAAVVSIEADHDVVLVGTDPVSGGLAAVDRGPDGAGDLGGGQPLQGCLLAVDVDPQLRLSLFIVVVQLGQAGNIRDGPLDVLGHGGEHREIFAPELDFHRLSDGRTILGPGHVDARPGHSSNIPGDLIQGKEGALSPVLHIQQVDGYHGAVGRAAGGSEVVHVAGSAYLGHVVLQIAGALDPLLDGPYHPVGDIEPGAQGSLHLDIDLFRFTVGKELHSMVEDPEQTQHRHPGGRHHGQEDEPPFAAAEQPVQAPFIAGRKMLQQPVADPFSLLLIQTQEGGGHHRIDHQPHEQGAGQGDDQSYGQVLHEISHEAAPEHQGDESQQRGGCGGDHGRTHLAGGFLGRLDQPFSFLMLAVDVFHDHHCVVHQHAQRQDQAVEHDCVQGVIQQAENSEADQHGQGYGDAHQQAVAAAEEEVEHQDYQQHAGDDVVLQVTHHGVDFLAEIGDDLVFD